MDLPSATDVTTANDTHNHDDDDDDDAGDDEPRKKGLQYTLLLRNRPHSGERGEK